MFVSNLNELVIFYSSWNLRAYGFLITSGKIWLIIKFFNFAYLKAIKFRGINYCGMYNSRVIKDEFLRDLFLVIRCARKILWNLFLLVGDLQDCCECFITEIRNKTNENRKKKDNFCGIYFCEWSSGNVLWNFFLLITKNHRILRNLFLRFRNKSAKIDSALTNFERINSLKLIFKANYGNIAKSQNETISSKSLHWL